MIKITTPGEHIIELYSDIKQLPIHRYNEMQKYLLMDSGVGSDIEAIQSRFARLHAFLAEGKAQEALKEAENLHYTHYSAFEKINYKSHAFCCIVNTIDGIIFEDVTEEGIKKTIQALEKTDMSQRLLEETLADVKKKSHLT